MHTISIALLAAVRAVAAGIYIDPSLGQLLLSGSFRRRLHTARERDVLRELALGHSNREIAATSISATKP